MTTHNRRIIISRDVVFYEHIYVDKQIAMAKDEEDLTAFNLFKNLPFRNLQFEQESQPSSSS